MLEARAEETHWSAAMDEKGLNKPSSLDLLNK